jgi:hypothetical protein
MTIQTRQITGPIETPEHEAVTSGVLRIDLLNPIAVDDTFIAPVNLEYAITNGDLPVTCKLVVPGKYEFRIYDDIAGRIWSFQGWVYPNSGSPISIAQLWMIAKLDGAGCSSECSEGFDAANLGSDGAPDGWVLTAQGDGTTEWEPIDPGLYGDMFKSVYDTNDDGCVDCADYAAEAGLAQNSLLFDNKPVAYFQKRLPNGTNAGDILIWNTGLMEWRPAAAAGSDYQAVTVVNQVYYEVDSDDSYILVIIEDDAEVVLPNPALEDGRVINIKRRSANNYDVVVSAAGGGLIEGDTSFILRHKYDAIKCVSINSEWYIY